MTKIHIVFKMEFFTGGEKMEEIILKEIEAEDIMSIISDCNETKEIVNNYNNITNDIDKSIEDCIYYGSSYSVDI
jgi:D-arabinose 5-phosphate isomerase GutQ